MGSTFPDQECFHLMFLDVIEFQDVEFNILTLVGHKVSISQHLAISSGWGFSYLPPGHMSETRSSKSQMASTWATDVIEVYGWF